MGEQAVVEKTKVDDKKVVYLVATDEQVKPEFSAAIESGDIRASVDVVDVKIKGLNEKGEAEVKTVSDNYVRYEALTAAGAILMEGGQFDLHEDKPSVLSRYNYARDLMARGELRTILLKKSEGPEKAIERGIKGLIAAGIKEARAIRMVVEGMIEEGELPEGFVYTKK